LGCQESVEGLQPWSGQVPFAVIHGGFFLMQACSKG